MNGLGDVVNDVAAGVVLDSLNRVEAQAVDVVLVNPVERVADNKAANGVTALVVVVDGLAPGSLVLGGEVRTELAEIIALVPKVVVDDVLNDCETLAMRGVDKATECRRTAVAGLNRVETDTVVSPIVFAGKSVDRQEFEGGDAEIFEIWKFGNGGVEGSFGRESSDVEFVNHVVAIFETLPVAILPFECGGIDDFGWTVNAFG